LTFNPSSVGGWREAGPRGPNLVSSQIGRDYSDAVIALRFWDKLGVLFQSSFEYFESFFETLGKSLVRFLGFGGLLFTFIICGVSVLYDKQFTAHEP